MPSSLSTRHDLPEVSAIQRLRLHPWILQWGPIIDTHGKVAVDGGAEALPAHTIRFLSCGRAWSSQYPNRHGAGGLEHASYLRSARPSSLCRCNVKAGDGSTQYADIRVEAESCVFYVSRISWKGIRGGDLSGEKKNGGWDLSWSSICMETYFLLRRLSVVVVLKAAGGRHSEHSYRPGTALCGSRFHTGVRYESQVCKSWVAV